MTQQNHKKVYLIIALVFAGLFFGNYGMYQISAIPAQVYEAYQLNDVQFSSVMTASMVPAIFFSILLGVLADRFGIKSLAAVCILLGFVGYVMRWISNSYTMLYTGMFLTGLLVTVFNTNISKIASSLCAPEKVASVVGILMTGSTASMAVAYGTTAAFPNMKSAFAFTAIATGILFILWLVCVRQKDFKESESVEAEKIPVMKGILTAVKSKNVWLMGLALGTLLGGAMVITNFQVAYLVSVKGYTEALAGTFGTVLMIGAIIGSLIVPMFLSRIKNPAVFLLVITLIAGACTAGIAVLPVAGIYVASFLNGFLRSAVISIVMVFPVMFPEIGPRYAGTATGVACTIQLLAAVIIPTYVVIPLAGGNMAAYFYWGAAFFVLSAGLVYVLARKLKFN